MTDDRPLREVVLELGKKNIKLLAIDDSISNAIQRIERAEVFTSGAMTRLLEQLT